MSLPPAMLPMPNSEGVKFMEGFCGSCGGKIKTTRIPDECVLCAVKHGRFRVSVVSDCGWQNGPGSSFWHCASHAITFTIITNREHVEICPKCGGIPKKPEK